MAQMPRLALCIAPAPGREPLRLHSAAAGSQPSGTTSVHACEFKRGELHLDGVGFLSNCGVRPNAGFSEAEKLLFVVQFGAKLSRVAEFRKDINGLRAWAVGAVVLYHFSIPGFDGGFVGVDIFFVISGFLMTGIVVSGLEQNSHFDLWGFFRARARRIIPALVVLCAVLLFVGWWVLIPAEYEQLGRHVASSLTFLSNIAFWNEAGYFDTASHEKWLLHTWSLAVEWQFYILLPIGLMVAWRFNPKRSTLFWCIALAFLTSLALSVVMTPIKPIASFFLLPTRAWEMLAGGLVYLAGNRFAEKVRGVKSLEWIGFLFIVLSIALFDESSSWPGWMALLPVFGVVAILLSKKDESPWTSNFLAQWLGARSYSVYLWHWPIVVLLTYFNARDDILAVLLGILFTLVLGHISYSLVELKAQKFFTKSRTWFLLTSAILTAMVGSTFALTKGWEGRLSPDIEIVAKESNNVKPRRDQCFTKSGTESPSCIYGAGDLRAILLGDSHADAVTTALAAAVPNGLGGVMDWSYISCPTIFGVRNLSPKYESKENCAGFLNWTFGRLKGISKDVPLVIVNRNAVYALGHNETWENDENIPMVYFSKVYTVASAEFLQEYGRRLTETACKLSETRKIYLMRPIPEMGVNVPGHVVRAMAWGKKTEISIGLDEYHLRNKFVWDAQDAAQRKCGVEILNPLPYLCHDGRCHGVKDGRPLYFDDDHLSEYGNKMLVPMFAKIFNNK